MNIVLEKSDFQNIILTVSNAVSTKSTMPILANILLVAKDKKLRCAATDLEVGLDCVVPATVNKEGGIALPARKLSEIVRELPDAPVSITVDNSVAKVSCEKTSFTLSGMPEEDFPPIPSFPKSGGFEIAQTLLKRMIEKTKFAVSTEELRYALNGLYFQTKDDELRLVATDGRRLSLIKSNLEKKIKEKLGVIIPTKAIQELTSILMDEGNVDIAHNENQIFFKTENTVLSSRLIDGQFPNYEQVIPAQCDKKALLKTARFLQSVRRVSILASEKTNSVKIALQKNVATVTANTPELGEAVDEFDVEYSGEELQVAYNGKYIMDVLKSIDTENTVLELNQPLSPGVFKPADDTNYTNVIMPMKLT